jgi:hypothetical protein
MYWRHARTLCSKTWQFQGFFTSKSGEFVGHFPQKSFEEVSALFPSFCVWPSGEIATQKNAGSAGMRFLQLDEP